MRFMVHRRHPLVKKGFVVMRPKIDNLTDEQICMNYPGCIQQYKFDPFLIK